MTEAVHVCQACRAIDRADDVEGGRLSPAVARPVEHARPILRDARLAEAGDQLRAAKHEA